MTAMSESPTIPAGWYAGPDGQRRYWDGSQWWDSEAPPETHTTPEGTPQPSGNRTMMRLLVVGVVAVVVIAAVVVGFVVRSNQKLTARGTFDLTDASIFNNNCDVAVDPSYADINSSTEVTIYVGDTAVGVTQLGSDAKQVPGNICEWKWSISGIPKASTYQVEVAHRGRVTFPSSDISSMGLTLGSN